MRRLNLLCLQAAWKTDQGTVTDSRLCDGKAVLRPRCWHASPTSCVQIFGGMGLMEEVGVERLWRDARVERIWDGTSEIQRHIISRAVLRPLE